ncbi:MAG: hypothetical protein D6729_17250, partial [Deltaproteobacteria bacterium]
AARVQLVAGDPARARREALRAFKSLRGRVRRHHRRADVLWTAEALLLAGETKNALRALARFGGRAKDYDLHLARARAYRATGKRREALRELEAAVRFNPAVPEAAALLAASTDSAGLQRIADAVGEAWGRLLEAWGTLRRGEVERARALLDRAQSETGETLAARLLRLRLAALAGEPGLREAVETLRSTARHNAAADTSAGEVLLALGRSEEAADAFEEALRIDPLSEEAKAGLAEAVARGAAADPGEAARRTEALVADLTRSRAPAPDLGRAAAAAAAAAARAGDRRATARLRRLATRVAPDDPRTHFLLGLSYEEAGDPKHALAAYRRATARRGAPEAFLRMATLPTTAPEAARPWLQAFLEQVPEHVRAGEARRLLGE